MVVAPFSLRGLAAPERLLRAGLLGVSSAKGVTSAGDNAVLEGLRVDATGLAFAALVVLVTGLLVSSLARLVAGIQELLSILKGQPDSLTI